MKRLAVCGLCLAAGAAMAAETVFFGQTIGQIAVKSTTQNTIVSVAFNELSAVDDAAITPKNLISTKNLSDNDRLYIYKNGVYSSWVKDGNDWVTPVAKVVNDASGNQSLLGADNPADVGSQVGEGFWLQRASVPTGEFTFYLYGAAVACNSTTAAPGVKSLMGNPLATAATFVTTGAHKGDRIGLVANNGVFMREYSYGKVNDEDCWAENTVVDGHAVVKKVTPTIPAGVGFWYNSTGSEQVNFVWSSVSEGD